MSFHAVAVVAVADGVALVVALALGAWVEAEAEPP